MKRFILTCALTIVVIAALLYTMPTDFAKYAASISDGEVCIYCRDTSLSYVDMGCGRIVRCSTSGLNEALGKCCGVDGISFSFTGSVSDMERIARRFSMRDISLQHPDGLTVMCGYSPKIRGGLCVDGRMVNMQIAYRDGTITVGSPLILGSY